MYFLPNCPKPFEDELMLSWLCRLAGRNVMSFRDLMIFVYDKFSKNMDIQMPLTLSQIPAHSHSFSWPKGDCIWENGTGNTWWGRSLNASSNTASAGGGQAHENRPPYYALYYIMKL